MKQQSAVFDIGTHMLVASGFRSLLVTDYLTIAEVAMQQNGNVVAKATDENGSDFRIVIFSDEYFATNPLLQGLFDGTESPERNGLSEPF